MGQKKERRMDYDSMATPKDRPERPIRQPTHPPLEGSDLVEAVSVLNKKAFAQVDRQYADPPLKGQKIVLFSFMPSKGAKPDTDGWFGMAKVRGVFGNEEEANEHAEKLIRDHDSYHEIFHAYVGKPFPVTNKSGYEEEIKTIDVKTKTVRLISEDILNKKRDEEKEIKEMHEREQNLLEESKRAKENLPEDPYDIYITDQVKRAQLIWTYKETTKKCEQMRDLIKVTNEKIAETEKENPEYRDQYKEKYMQARSKAGLGDDKDDDSFVKYLGVDLLTDEDLS
jgi:hypothetical protein